jgi:Holliday junction resolvase-like predicted endonuclease
MGKPVHKMSPRKQRMGELGENEASGFLSSLGNEIMARNVRTPRGENVILAKLEDVTVFIEVRTLTSNRIAHPEETIPRHKQPPCRLLWKTTLNCMELPNGKSTPSPSRENREANRKSLILRTFQDDS